MQGKLGGFLNKARDTAAGVGGQAQAMFKEGQARTLGGGGGGGGAASGISASASGFMQGFSLPGESAKAAKILRSFLANPESPVTALNSIPKAVLQRAKGLAVFTIVKAGFVFSGKAGSGLVVARLPDGSWSAPSCIATAGVGWGLQIGADLTEVVIVLNSDAAVKAFSRGGNVTVGGGLSAAAGPLGVGGQVAASLANPAPMFSYSRSKGLFAGLTLDGTILVERKDANRDFYGSTISSTDILTGRVPPPEIASEMYDVIEGKCFPPPSTTPLPPSNLVGQQADIFRAQLTASAAEGIDESSLPAQSYVPGQAGSYGGQQIPVQPAAFPGSGQPLGNPPPAAPGQGNQTVFELKH